MSVTRGQIKKRGTTLSGLSAEVFRDINGNITFNGSGDEIFVNAKAGDFRLTGTMGKALGSLGALGADFHVQAGSPAIGMGVPLAEVKTDIEGYPRDPVHPTIGAYEYHGSSSDGPPVIIQEPVPQPWTPPELQPQPIPIPTPVVQQYKAATQAPSAPSTPSAPATPQASGANLSMIAAFVVGGVVLAAMVKDD